MSGDYPAQHQRPRWLVVLVVVIVVALLVLLSAIVLGGGEHGPSRHSQQPADLMNVEGLPR